VFSLFAEFIGLSGGVTKDRHTIKYAGNKNGVIKWNDTLSGKANIHSIVNSAFGERNVREIRWVIKERHSMKHAG
jgi:hypothetical protein